MSAASQRGGGNGGLVLAVGDEEYLVERVLSRVVVAARAVDQETEVVDVSAGSLGPGELDAALSPSLFGGRRVVVLRNVQDVSKDGVTHLLAAVAGRDEETVLVATSPGGGRGKAVIDGLVAAGGVVERCDRLTSPAARADFVTAEVRAHGGRATSGAGAVLVASLGSDLRELAAAASQLVSDTGGQVDEEAVARYYRGRADASGFAVADRAMDGDSAATLELLRWALSTGVAPVLVTSSLAANLRLIASVAGEGRQPAARVAKTLGQPPWKVERAMRWSRHWAPLGLASAVQTVARADADVKGAAADPAYAVERAVLAVTSARSMR